MIPLLRYVLCVMVLCVLGCASSWTLHSETAERPPLWPPDPAKARIKHVATIRGFRESGASASSTLRSIAYGNENDILLKRPVAIAAGRDSRLAIADTGSRCVHLYIPERHEYHALSTARSEELRSPVGVIFDDDLNLYVSDSVLGRVFVYNPHGTYLFSIGHTSDRYGR